MGYNSYPLSNGLRVIETDSVDIVDGINISGYVLKGVEKFSFVLSLF